MSSLFSSPSEQGPAMGPIFIATYDSADSCCGLGLFEGERIRSDGEGGWIHEDCDDPTPGRDPRPPALGGSLERWPEEEVHHGHQ